MSEVKRIYFAVVFAAAMWSLIVVGVSLFSGDKLMFIPQQADLGTEALAQRAEVLRLSFFLLFAYFAMLHIFVEKRKISAGHVLLSIMTSLTLVGTIKLATLDDFTSEAGYVVLFGISALLIFLGSRPSVRRYFKRRM